MDFSNRSAQPQNTAPVANSSAAAAPAGRRTNRADRNKWITISTVVLLFSVVILIIGVIAFIAFGNNSNDQYKYVDTNKLQAVFLESGQVYFGSIKAINNNYFVLQDIYYLQTSGSSSTAATSSSSSSVSLVKLGCELHAPYDQMVINTDQVTFWENLQSDGQVATAVANFQKANPNGQKCSDQSSAASTTGGTVQNAGTTDTTK